MADAQAIRQALQAATTPEALQAALALADQWLADHAPTPPAAADPEREAMEDSVHVATMALHAMRA